MRRARKADRLQRQPVELGASTPIPALPPSRGKERLNPKAFALILPALLSACAVGPDFHTPAPPTANAYAPTPAAAPEGQVLHQGQTTPDQWWRAFGSDRLDALVDEALKANPDLASADAALRQAREAYAAQRGALLPAIEVDGLSQRATTSAAVAPVPADNNTLYSLHTAEVQVTYVLDVFGGVRRATEAAKAQAQGQRFQYEAARTTLIANVVAGAVQAAALRAEVQAARQAEAAALQTLAFTRRQVELGALGQGDVAAQEALLAQAQQGLPPLQKALAAQDSALAILLGREPGQGAAPDLTLDEIVLPPDLPLALPAQLVRQRPDVRAAEAQLHAAGAQVGVAIAARLPAITLSGAAGGQSLNIASVLSSPNQFWTLSAGVTQPLFQGGALLHRQKEAQAALDQAKDQYRSTVLQALKSMADTLDALGRDSEALAIAAKAEAASRRSLDFARRQQTLGQIGALAERAAEQTQAQAALALIAARAARYADTAALFQALGGGWSGGV
jgi:NodT family efflux transporter outer membrane factor (OMF) lipoprotein